VRPSRSSLLLTPLFGDDQVGEDATALLSQARRDRVVPLLVRLIGTGDGVDAADLEKLLLVERANMAHAVTLEHHLLGVVGLLADRGIRSAVLKGVAVAHLDYPDPCWRQFGDADLLVDPNHFEPALQLLRGAGWRNESEVSEHHDRFTHALPMRHERGVIIDVHQAIGRRALGRLIPADVLLDTAVPFEIAGIELRALADPFRLAHACVHWLASRGTYKRLSGAADIIVMSRRLASGAGGLLDELGRYQVDRFVQTGIAKAFAVAQEPVPSGWEPFLRPSARPDLVARAHLSPDRRPVLEELAFLTKLDGREWLPYLRGYLDVGDDYRAKHGRSGPLDQLRYLGRKLRNRA